FREPFRDSQSLQDFRREVVHRQQLVARAAILSNSGPICCCVPAVMTTEASWKIGVTQVIGIRTPRHLQVRKNIAIIDPEHRQPPPAGYPQPAAHKYPGSFAGSNSPAPPAASPSPRRCCPSRPSITQRPSS